MQGEGTSPLARTLQEVAGRILRAHDGNQTAAAVSLRARYKIDIGRKRLVRLSRGDQIPLLPDEMWVLHDEGLALGCPPLLGSSLLRELARRSSKLVILAPLHVDSTARTNRFAQFDIMGSLHLVQACAHIQPTLRWKIRPCAFEDPNSGELATYRHEGPIIVAGSSMANPAAYCLIRDLRSRYRDLPYRFAWSQQDDQARWGADSLSPEERHGMRKVLPLNMRGIRLGEVIHPERVGKKMWTYGVCVAERAHAGRGPTVLLMGLSGLGTELVCDLLARETLGSTAASERDTLYVAVARARVRETGRKGDDREIDPDSQEILLEKTFGAPDRRGTAREHGTTLHHMSM